MTAPAHPTYPELQLLGVRPPILTYLRQVWRRRDFATAIAAGEVRSQNMNTVLGNFWHILNPLLLSGVYILIFGIVLEVTRQGVENVPGFILIGVMIYHYSQKSVMGGAKAISSNEGLIRSIRFPRAVLPLSTVLGHAFAFIPAVFVMLVIVVLTGILGDTNENPTLHWFLLLPVLLVQTMFNIGAAFVLARLGDSYRDLQNVLPYLFRLIFYASGVLYSVDRFVDEGPLRALFDFNPFYVYISLVRWLLLEETALEPQFLITGSVWAVAMLVGGFLYFRAGEERYGRT
jgi:teichoic acid transport system permease protein